MSLGFYPLTSKKKGKSKNREIEFSSDTYEGKKEHKEAEE